MGVMIGERIYLAGNPDLRWQAQTVDQRQGIL
jgi:hypothetical protein